MVQSIDSIERLCEQITLPYAERLVTHCLYWSLWYGKALFIWLWCGENLSIIDEIYWFNGDNRLIMARLSYLSFIQKYSLKEYLRRGRGETWCLTTVNIWSQTIGYYICHKDVLKPILLFFKSLSKASEIYSVLFAAFAEIAFRSDQTLNSQTTLYSDSK